MIVKGTNSTLGEYLKDVPAPIRNAVTSAATSGLLGKDPEKAAINSLVGSFMNELPSAKEIFSGFTGPNSQTAVGGGADPGYFDEQNEVIGLPAWAIDPYAESAPLFPEFEAPLLTAEPAPEPDQRIDVTGTREVPIEQNAFEQYMQQYAAPAEQTLFPEFEQPLLTAEPVDNETAKFLRQQELAQAGESALGGIGPNAKELPLINLSGAPAPAPGKAPAAPKKVEGPDFEKLLLASMMMTPQQQAKDDYQLAQIGVQSPYGIYGAL